MNAPAVLYWDASAVLSILLQDRHSGAAQAWARRTGFHLLSTLAWAEVHAILGRAQRERVVAAVLLSAARESLEAGPWHRVNVSPDWQTIQDLASRWSLRGADLWHLAAAKSLQAELPELFLLSYDARLTEAARGEGLVEDREDRHSP
ncbi:MAG: type II toxin-antitoxin system VapC family toxin [Armatimonadetes bacterium]|nr:type II toxin-antitoxin system VapC family toxin [Armatimonadota bacterium]